MTVGWKKDKNPTAIAVAHPLTEPIRSHLYPLITPPTINVLVAADGSGRRSILLISIIAVILVDLFSIRKEARQIERRALL